MVSISGRSGWEGFIFAHLTQMTGLLYPQESGDQMNDNLLQHVHGSVLCLFPFFSKVLVRYRSKAEIQTSLRFRLEPDFKIALHTHHLVACIVVFQAGEVFAPTTCAAIAASFLMHEFDERHVQVQK